jgi:hypothetical protein
MGLFIADGEAYSGSAGNNNQQIHVAASSKKKVIKQSDTKKTVSKEKKASKQSRKKKSVQKPLKIIHHKTPVLKKISLIPFKIAGCVLDKKKNMMHCRDGADEIFACDEIMTPPAQSAGLKPLFPFVQCIKRVRLERKKVSGEMKEFGDYIRTIGDPDRVGLLRFIFWDNGFHLIKTQEEFKKTFSPIESEDEAVSYAVTLTGDEALYNIKVPKRENVFVDEIEDTHVLRTENGYVVNLFRHFLYGCGTHPVFSKKYFIGTDGGIKLLEKKKLFIYPEETGKCLIK